MPSANHPPILTLPSAAQLRDELETLVINDLPGPAAGQTEEMDELRITERYLVGKIAPQNAVVPRDQDDELTVALSDTPSQLLWSPPRMRSMMPPDFPA